VLVVFGIILAFLLKRRGRRQDSVSVFGSNRKEEYRTEVNLRRFNRQRSYDPSDPSTYPNVPFEDNYSGAYTTTTPRRSGLYTGAAEL
jgi:hypothetical protein